MEHQPGRGRVYENFAATMGDTPLVRIPRLKEKHGVSADILLKCEFFNPMASVKDRIGVAMIETAERKLQEDDTVNDEPDKTGRNDSQHKAAPLQRCVNSQVCKFRNEKGDAGSNHQRWWCEQSG